MKSTLLESYEYENQEVFNKRFGVVFDGENNLKSLSIENLIDGSPTATQCANIYASFLGGAGFLSGLKDVNLNENEWEKLTPNDLLSDVCESISRHQGVFIHIGYNGAYEKESLSVIPYTLCRVGKKDKDGFSGRIIVSEKGWGRSLKQADVKKYNAYNPNPKAIQAQVEACGGWENYKGQIFYFKMSRKSTYTTSLIEVAQNFADVEHKMSLFYRSTVNRGFNDVTIVRHRNMDEPYALKKFADDAKSVTGAEGSSSVWMIEDDWDDDSEKGGNIRFDKIPNESKPDKFAHFEQSAANFIRKAFKNIPPQLVDLVQGKLGNSSGEDLIKAQSIYNASTSNDRRKIEGLFSELFRNYKENINPLNDWTINQYKLLDDGTVTD